MRLMLVGNNDVTMVDDDVYDVLHVHTWRVDKNGYVESTIDKKNIRLHRIIMSAPKGMQVDHINHNLLDNRRENLRVCTNGENSRNKKKRKDPSLSSKYKGVYKDIRKYKDRIYEYWGVNVKLDGKVVFKKYFKNEEEAARAYDKAAKQYHGEFALLNFPDES